MNVVKLSSIHYKTFQTVWFVSYGKETYRNDPKFLDRQIWANSVDPDQTAPDQGLHCLPFRLHLSDTSLYVQTLMFNFDDNCNIFEPHHDKTNKMTV